MLYDVSTCKCLANLDKSPHIHVHVQWNLKLDPHVHNTIEPQAVSTYTCMVEH